MPSACPRIHLILYHILSVLLMILLGYWIGLLGALIGKGLERGRDWSLSSPLFYFTRQIDPLWVILEHQG